MSDLICVVKVGPPALVWERETAEQAEGQLAQSGCPVLLFRSRDSLLRGAVRQPPEDDLAAALQEVPGDRHVKSILHG